MNTHSGCSAARRLRTSEASRLASRPETAASTGVRNPSRPSLGTSLLRVVLKSWPIAREQDAEERKAEENYTEDLVDE
jgi:hypothetical protein